MTRVLDMKNAFKIKVEKPVEDVLSDEYRKDTIEKLDARSVEDIDSYGSESWNSTNDQINGIYAEQKKFESEVSNNSFGALTRFGDKYTTNKSINITE